ncbi:MAG: tetratricopeptide repeat protein [Acidobacteria bacterium]|nr:tetratricopeptide repeat protein [Acidobacteriota bacterium]
MYPTAAAVASLNWPSRNHLSFEQPRPPQSSLGECSIYPLKSPTRFREDPDCKKALVIKPESATTHHNVGAAYFAMNKYEEEFASYAEAFRLDPTILDRISTRGTIIRTAEVNQGIQNCYLTKLFVTNGQPEKALSYLLKALETGFSDYEKITKDPVFKVLAQDERLTRMISQKHESAP